MENNPTHAVTQPNKRPATAIDTFKVKLAQKDSHNQLLNLLGSEDEVRRFQTSAIDYVRRVPKLLQTDPQSLLLALITAAQFRFLPSSVAGEAYIIPYGNEAKFQIGYQGWVTLLYRGGRVKGISAEVVYANDSFEYEAGLEPKLVHKPKMDGPRGEPVAVYTIAQLGGGVKTFHVMSKDEVMAIKNTSKAKGKADSPWNSGDPLLAMWKKTCLIQHQKFLPKTPDIVKALEVDFEGEGMERPSFDAAGPATGRAAHAPTPVPHTDLGPLCPKGKHRGRMSEDGADCNACLEEDLAASEGAPPPQGADIQA